MADSEAELNSESIDVPEKEKVKTIIILLESSYVTILIYFFVG